jgi:uncharacterized protein YndB with AHSA1/START domain
VAVSGAPDPLDTEIAAHGVEAGAREQAGGWVLTMTRELRAPAGRVWPMLTEPTRLRRWSPVVPDRSLTAVGPALARETPGQPAVDAEVLDCDPPCLLVHRWGGQVLRWSLAPAGAGSRLTLEETVDAPAELGIQAAGWHLCLAVLSVLLDGHRVERVVGSRALDRGWQDLRERYDRALAEPPA